jgi:Xaa-Pro aminopeptidase
MVGAFIADPFVYFRVKGRGHVVLSDLEYDRGRQQIVGCRVLRLSKYLKKLPGRLARGPVLARVIRLLARERRVKRFVVPASFPYGLARDLRRLKIRVKVKEGSLFPERELKSAAEVRKISAALTMAEIGLAEGIHALKNSKIGPGGKLLYHNAPLTSEKLRAIINVAIMQAGGCATHTIVAGGRQACDPHETGLGRLRANQPIIIDIFPRSLKTGYYGDITRTMVRGRASDAVHRLYAAVDRAQTLAFSLLRDKARAADVHKAVQDFFASEGFKTDRRNGHFRGFFHGTGHGLGLEVHEAPRIGAASDSILRAGQVVTVEPGLYYPGVGAVRLEDVAWITKAGARNLTQFEKSLEV